MFWEQAVCAYFANNVNIEHIIVHNMASNLTQPAGEESDEEAVGPPLSSQVN